MKLHEAIETLSVLALRLEELQKALVDLNKQSIRAGLQVEQALKEAEKIYEWSQPPKQVEHNV